jgi:two-component system chemotaxis response regulator CheB
MLMREKIIRVLVVDDSGLVRDLLRATLESAPGIAVVGEAKNGREAIAKVSALKPDVVTMDIEMPVMGGLEAIERIIAEHPVPILVITALTGVRTAFAAVSKGAMDVIEKPDISHEKESDLIRKIRLLANVDMRNHLKILVKEARTAGAAGMAISRAPSPVKVVAIAASTGGPQAIHHILAQLPADFPAPIVITQHIAEGFTQGLVDWLDMGTPLKVRVAGHGDRLAAGQVYINPAERSMRITGQGVILIADPEARQLYHPSCDTLLSSVATAYRNGVVALIMSGMGDDGVAGMQSVQAAGGVTLAQDEKSSVVYGMNRLAVERGNIQKIVPLVDIPAEFLTRVCGAK